MTRDDSDWPDSGWRRQADSLGRTFLACCVGFVGVVAVVVIGLLAVCRAVGLGC